MQAHRNDWYAPAGSCCISGQLRDRCLRRMSMLYYGINSSPVPIRGVNSVLVGPTRDRISQKRLTQLLDDKDAHIRSWAIQLLCEDFKPGNAALKKFASMAASDSSPVVRLYLAAALQRSRIGA